MSFEGTSTMRSHFTVPRSTRSMGDSSVSTAIRVRKRAMSSRKISSTERSIQRSPKLTRWRPPRPVWTSERVSSDCWKSATRVSCHSRCWSSTGEFTAAASTGAVTTWARLYSGANSSGPTWKCTWKLVLQASSITLSWVAWSSSTPLIRVLNSFPRSRHIMSLSCL